MPRRWLLNLSFFVSLSIMIFEAPVFAEESEFPMDDSVKRALDAAKQGRSESAARIGQVFCHDVFAAQQCFYHADRFWIALHLQGQSTFASRFNVYEFMHDS